MMEAILNSPFFGLSMCVSTYIFGRWVQKKTGFEKKRINKSIDTSVVIEVGMCRFLTDFVDNCL